MSISILVLDKDNRTFELLKQAYKTLYQKTKIPVQVYFKTGLDRFSYESQIFDIILVDKRIIHDSKHNSNDNDTNNANTSNDLNHDSMTVRGWMKDLRACLGDSHRLPPLLLMDYEVNTEKISSFIHQGFDDFIVKPVDRVLIMERIASLSDQFMGVERKKFYFSPAPKDGSKFYVAKKAHLETVWETHCDVRSPSPFKPNEVFLLHGDVFGKIPFVLARCKKCQLYSKSQNDFIVRFHYIGVSPKVLKSIRQQLQTKVLHNYLSVRD